DDRVRRLRRGRHAPRARLLHRISAVFTLRRPAARRTAGVHARALANRESVGRPDRDGAGDSVRHLLRITYSIGPLTARAGPARGTFYRSAPTRWRMPDRSSTASRSPRTACLA